jgi:hypothetical protein
MLGCDWRFLFVGLRWSFAKVCERRDAAQLDLAVIRRRLPRAVEGRALRSLREIRVAAAPSWDAEAVELMFWFIRDDRDATFEGQDWSAPLEKWLQLVPKSGRYVRVEGQVATQIWHAMPHSETTT